MTERKTNSSLLRLKPKESQRTLVVGVCQNDDMSFVKTYNSTTEAFSKDGYTSSGISQAVKNKNKYKKLNWKYE